jgi:hypothetical protein
MSELIKRSKKWRMERKQTKMNAESLREDLDAGPLVLNPKSCTRNPKPETRNPKPETRNPKPETRNPILKGIQVHFSIQVPWMLKVENPKP